MSHRTRCIDKLRSSCRSRNIAPHMVVHDPIYHFYEFAISTKGTTDTVASLRIHKVVQRRHRLQNRLDEFAQHFAKYWSCSGSSTCFDQSKFQTRHFSDKSGSEVCVTRTGLLHDKLACCINHSAISSRSNVMGTHFEWWVNDLKKHQPRDRFTMKHRKWNLMLVRKWTVINSCQPERHKLVSEDFDRVFNCLQVRVKFFQMSNGMRSSQAGDAPSMGSQ